MMKRMVGFDVGTFYGYAQVPTLLQRQHNERKEQGIQLSTLGV